MPLTRHLTPLEARVLGVLIEKQHTVPDTYPLSLNSLTLGCNQKTARQPVMEAAESDVLGALDSLKSLSLVFEVGGSRVTKYEHNGPRVLGVPGAAMALLCVLMLRGPQTAAELRTNSERLHRFADLSSVEGFLDELAARAEPFAVKLARAPGAREARWAQLLTGPLSAEAMAAAAAAASAGPVDEAGVGAAEVAAMRSELSRLAAEVAQLRGQVARLAGELGVDLSQGA